ncbi:hypothetical protein F4692_003156 [Nocardioides cavernae]|uniref:Uncharacterized protein n=1 Tax=Nocardioides cavernae TaxID=1921566 RepID=A0A7Y9H5D9_9ACTN|nr:hypothetical protein [Nocardioides cavernae]NYE38011.1 hypothetical protein [Nocardioides cavernae]
MTWRDDLAFDPFEEPFPQAWEELLQEMVRAGGAVNLREAAAARLDAYVRLAELQHRLLIADRHQRLMSDAEAASKANTRALLDQAAAQDRQATAANSHAASLKWATWALVAATVVLIIVTALGG